MIEFNLIDIKAIVLIYALIILWFPNHIPQYQASI